VKIATIGRGNVGGGLAKLWRDAGHEVEELGRGGGDASGADVVLVALPSDAIADALGKVSGIDGKPTIDATNALGGRNENYDSLAEQVKAIVAGPTVKAFNLNFARIYDQVSEQSTTPSMPWCGDDEARELTERLIRDAGYEPLYCGGLDKARALEDALGFLFAAMQAAGEPVFFRVWAPGEL
jgi:8-hydroxy-5-deazaflavin:NADPH oxidoreductase